MGMKHYKENKATTLQSHEMKGKTKRQNERQWNEIEWNEYIYIKWTEYIYIKRNEMEAYAVK